MAIRLPRIERIAVDMDEVLADALGELLLRYNRDFQGSLTRADQVGKWMWETIPVERQERLSSYLREDDFFENLPVIENSQQVLARLAQRYEIFIATAAMEFPNSFGPKYRWLRRNFSFLDPHKFVFCGDKSILNADYLIDDMPGHFRHFSGQGILFTAPHNARLEGYRRAENWQQVAQQFLK